MISRGSAQGSSFGSFGSRLEHAAHAARLLKQSVMQKQVQLPVTPSAESATRLHCPCEVLSGFLACTVPALAGDALLLLRQTIHGRGDNAAVLLQAVEHTNSLKVNEPALLPTVPGHDPAKGEATGIVPARLH